MGKKDAKIAKGPALPALGQTAGTAPGPDSTGGAFIEVKGLDVYFGRPRALAKVSLEVPKGARVALLGPNGAGKSTLIKAICGALDPAAGSVRLDGRRPEEALLDPGFLGWLPEGAPLNSELTVREHLELTYRLRGLGKVRGRREIERLSQALNLSKKLDRLSGALSMGSKRQAALALAFLGTPELLVLDEPTSSLDPDEIRRFNRLVEALPPTATLIVSSHILSEVAAVTDRAIFLNRGQIVGQGGWEDLPGGKADPSKSYFGVIDDGQAG
ncbi:MAG: ABC transporter ATP-binding protein [Deltaproteobacteria bacterium]|jgi:ABC-type multidrug transport system ATPase subunit|nr:ABC transporter ATP-binding protein [Deltaproteobacteria bacterium]